MKLSLANILLAIFICTYLPAFAQVKGTILSSKDEPIPNVTVKVDHKSFGTTTDDNGNFHFHDRVGASDVLLIQAVGYQTLKYPLKDKSNLEQLKIHLTEDNLNVHEVVVSATRYGVSRKEAPVIVNVLSPKLFNATQSVAMFETLNYQPGVRVENNCQNCGFSQVRLNGLEGAYSQILINSRSVFSALNSVYGLDQIPTSMIDRIEVVRSGGSALFGANAIAGTINIITKDPVENDWQIKSMNSLINGKSWENSIDFNTSYIDNDLLAGVTFYGMHRNRQAFDANGDGFSEMTKLRNTVFGTKAFIKPSEYNKITLDLSVLEEFRRGGDNLDLAPHFTDVTEQLRTNSILGGLTYDHYSKDWKQKWSLYVSAQKNNRESFYGGLGGGREKQDSVIASNAYGETADIAGVVGTQYTYHFEKDVFTSGVEFNFNNTEDKIPGYGRLIDQKSKSVGAYAQYEWKTTDRLKTLIGTRYDHTYINGNYQLTNLNRNSKENFGTLSPRLTILYDITSNIQFRGGYARGFRAPQAFNEDMHVTSIGGQQVFVLIGDNLKTEYSNAYTGSFNFNRNFGSTQASLLIEGFYTQILNPFTNVLTSEGDGIRIEEMRNGEGANVYGSNIELNVAPSSMLSFQMGGTIQRSLYKKEQLIYEAETEADNITSKKFMRAPNNYGYLNTNWKATDKFSVDLTSVYTGKMYVPHVQQDQRVIIKHARDFFEMNLRLGYTIPIKKELNIEIFGGMQNIFNAYQRDFDRGATRDSNYIYGPSRPRTYTFGLRLGHFH